jgi:hypothetical protein
MMPNFSYEALRPAITRISHGRHNPYEKFPEKSKI